MRVSTRVAVLHPSSPGEARNLQKHLAPGLGYQSLGVGAGRLYLMVSPGGSVPVRVKSNIIGVLGSLHLA